MTKTSCCFDSYGRFSKIARVYNSPVLGVHLSCGATNSGPLLGSWSIYALLCIAVRAQMCFRSLKATTGCVPIEVFGCRCRLCAFDPAFRLGATQQETREATAWTRTVGNTWPSVMGTCLQEDWGSWHDLSPPQSERILQTVPEFSCLFVAFQV